MSHLAIGADVGGSHITTQLYHLGQHQLIPGTKKRMEVDCHASADEILQNWVLAIRNAAADIPVQDLRGIGFAMPGPFDYHGGVAWFEGVEKFDHLHGVDVRAEMRSRLGLACGDHIRFLNDAACFAIGESVSGCATGYNRFLAITLGTGFGTTFLNENVPVVGGGFIPQDGFLYHIPFNDSNADNHFSTRWFLREYHRLTGNHVKGVRELMVLADQQGTASALFDQFGRNLSHFLTPWLKKFNAQALVMGGNIVKAYPLFSRALSKGFLDRDLHIPVLISTLQEDAALAGAAMLCDDHLYARLAGVEVPSVV